MPQNFGGDSTKPAATTADVEPIKPRILEKGEANIPEHERQFKIEEIVALIKEFDIKAVGELKVTRPPICSHEGVLLSVDLRAPGSLIGYCYKFKGDYGSNNETLITTIGRIYFIAADSEDYDFAKPIADYDNEKGVWVKQ